MQGAGHLPHDLKPNTFICSLNISTIVTFCFLPVVGRSIVYLIFAYNRKERSVRLELSSRNPPISFVSFFVCLLPSLTTFALISLLGHFSFPSTSLDNFRAHWSSC